MSASWIRPVHLRELARGPVRQHVEPDAAVRAEIARDLGLEGLPALAADVIVRPWLDGAELVLRFRGRVEQICSVSLEPFEQLLEGEANLRFLPAGSSNITSDEAPGGELTLDPEAPDPPEVLEQEDIDVGAYLLEAVALEIDPFPRKPGAQFDYTPPPEDDSPFRVLKQLREKKD